MRIEQITFTRFIAAISIVIFHCGKDSFLFNNKYVSFIFEQANLGVSYFFILSGFVMIIAYGNQVKVDFFDYIKNRLARIYPIYFIAILIILAISLFQNINIENLLLNLFMIQSWLPDKALTLNFPGWSLSVEMFFYIIFPFLFNNIFSKSKFKTISVSIILFWLISQIIFHLIVYQILKIPYFSIRDMNYNPILHLNEFLVGNLAGIYFIKKVKDNKKNYLPFIFATLLVLILFLKFPFGLNFQNGFLAIVFIPLILLISLSNDKVTNLFTKKIFVFLGEISFGIYILHIPVWIVFSDYRMEKYLGLNKESDFTTSFLIRLLILFVISCVSYVYIEKPLRNIIKKI